MIQFSDEHGGNTVKSCATLAGNCFQRMQGAKVRRREDHRSAVRNTGQVSKHHAEAMIKRHRNTESVSFGQAHPFSNPKTVVEKVVVRKHCTLGETGGSGGVLNIYDIVEIERR